MISSPNIKSAIARLESAQVKLSTAIQSAVSPEYYHDKLSGIARKTIKNYMDRFGGMSNDARDASLVILATFACIGTENGFDASLGGMPVAQGEPPTPDAIRAWINSGLKDLDQALDFDAQGNLDYERIIFRVMRSIKQYPEHWFGTSQPGHGAWNPTGLARFLGFSPYEAQRISSALVVVLENWSRYIRKTAPRNIQQAIHECFATQSKE